MHERQTRREQENNTLSTDDNIAIFPLTTPLLDGPAAITSLMVIASSPAGKPVILIGYGTMVAVMLGKATVVIIASLAMQQVILK